MMDHDAVKRIESKYLPLKDEMSERVRRHWAAVEAIALGYGGISVLSQATGLAISTIRRGIHEIQSGQILVGRDRREGAGRKKSEALDTNLKAALDRLIEPGSRGDPMSALRWTCLSTRRLAKELRAQGYAVGATKVRQLLKEAGYSLQGNRKTQEGKSHPDRDAQFRHINRRVATAE